MQASLASPVLRRRGPRPSSRGAAGASSAASPGPVSASAVSSRDAALGASSAPAPTGSEPDAAPRPPPRGAAAPPPSRVPDASKWTLSPGAAEPLGASVAPSGGVNFSLASPRATSVTLCVFGAADGEPLGEFPLSRAGGSDGGGGSPDAPWSGELSGPGVGPGLLYGYKVSGDPGDRMARWTDRVLLDPYAKGVWGRRRFGVRDEREGFSSPAGSVFRGVVAPEATVAPFDWGDDDETRPRTPLRDLVIYEVPVRTFTASPSSALGDDALRGTFAGLAAKADHLAHLGINAVELLPVFEYDELEFQRFPNPRDHMVNVWGYSHVGFFSPSSRLAAAGAEGGPAAASREFKAMVKALHARGIEVILDVVYNHTAEGGDELPYELSWRGIDAGAYYQQTPEAPEGQRIANWSGCGNTFNANGAEGMRLVLDSLRHWVTEYRVDGFRFDLAPCLCRDARGAPIAAPPVIEAIALDPVLARAHIIAEPWDLGLYQVGTFPNWDAWSEWNGKFRDDVRGFVRGDAGAKKAFATRMAGSADLYRYNARKPSDSINFVVCHDGFTLRDLISYNDKHNGANGEGGRDGTDDNVSWNCGAEGDTDDPAVVALRARQAKNLHLALMVSQGTPMILAGDEYLQTRGGNNNWYGHDGPLTWFDWDALTRARDSGWYDYYRGLIRFRRAHALLGRDEFLTPNDVSWHEDRWDDDGSRFLAWTLHDRGQGDGDVYVAFNAHGFSVRAGLPPPPHGARWYRVVDTNLPSPDDFVEHGVPGVGETYELQPHSAILLLAKPSP